MRILFAISILALVALLWATISIAQYIRRGRLLRRSGRLVNDLPEPVETNPASTTQSRSSKD